MLETLPPPSEQTDRELRGAAEAIRLRARYSFERGEFAEAFDLAAPYIPELDRMRPETLNALMKVLLYALLSSDRLDEAREMVDAGLRLRGEADLFTAYELLLHAANYAWKVKEIDALRSHALELRSLVDRYPSYRGLSTNFWHLPYVLAFEGDAVSLERLQRSFTAAPPPPRSTPIQTAIARLRFLECWNMLGNPEEALAMADTIDRTTLPPHLARIFDRDRLRSQIDLLCDDPGRKDVAEIELEEGMDDPVTTMLLLTLRGLLGDPEPLLAWYTAAGMPEEVQGDHMRGAHALLIIAESSPGRKREFNDAAYAALSSGIAALKQSNAPQLAHHLLDRLSDILPRTRLSRFRKEIGPDRREREAGGSDSSEKGNMGVPEKNERTLRTFGALRMEGEGVDEGGTKIESKTRSLVAALVVSRLGDTRWIGELTRDRLSDLLWPDMTIDRAANNLHATTSYARRFLGGSDTIQQVDGVYQLSDAVAIDALDFRACISKANRLYDEGVYFGAAVAYRSAVDLAEGDFLEGMYAEWIDNMRETLRGELATALERLMALEVDRENYQAIPPLAERLLALDDLHDGAYEALIRSAAARGARREAFTYFKRYETALEEYGAGPTRKISELIEKVRSGEEIGRVRDAL